MYTSYLWQQFILGLLEQDRGGGSGGSSSDADTNASDDDAADVTDDTADDVTETDEDDDEPVVKRQDPAKAFEQLLERYNGDTQALSERLFRDNFKLRASKRLQSEQITDLQKQLPRSGAKQLPKQEFAAYQDYKKLGTPKQIRETQAELARLRGELTEARQESTIANVAKVTGYNASALKELGGKLTYEVREIEVDGAKRNEAFVVEVDTMNGQKVRKETPVKVYASEKWKVFLPSLTAGDGSTDDTNGSERANGKRFVRQATAGSTNSASNNGNKGVASGYLQRAYGKKQEAS